MSNWLQGFGGRSCWELGGPLKVVTKVSVLQGVRRIRPGNQVRRQENDLQSKTVLQDMDLPSSSHSLVREDSVQ